MTKGIFTMPGTKTVIDGVMERERESHYIFRPTGSASAYVLYKLDGWVFEPTFEFPTKPGAILRNSNGSLFARMRGSGDVWISLLSGNSYKQGELAPDSSGVKPTLEVLFEGADG